MLSVFDDFASHYEVVSTGMKWEAGGAESVLSCVDNAVRPAGVDAYGSPRRLLGCWGCRGIRDGRLASSWSGALRLRPPMLE